MEIKKAGDEIKLNYKSCHVPENYMVIVEKDGAGFRARMQSIDKEERPIEPNVAVFDINFGTVYQAPCDYALDCLIEFINAKMFENYKVELKITLPD